MSYTMCSHDKKSRSGTKVVTGSSSATRAGLSQTPVTSGGTKVR
jgi:hypothetical protein